MRKSRGFTLVELLVVIAIIGVLAGLLMPVISGAMVSAKKAEDLNNLKQIGAAAAMYAQQKPNRFPHVGDRTNGIAGDNGWPEALECLSLLVRKEFVDNLATFRSPVSRMEVQDAPDWDDKASLESFLLRRENCSYGWTKKMRKPGDRSSYPLSSTAYVDVDEEAEAEGGVDPYQCFRDGINVLYLDGRVAWVGLDDQQEMENVVKWLVVSDGLERYVEQ